MRSKTILIAEDDTALAKAIAMRLEQLGFATMRSPDAMHALLGVHKLQPDLIIQDINMPGGNGIAACEMLASDPTLAKIPVIIHTGCSDEQTKRRAREIGAQYVLKTPGSWTQLRAAVCDLIGEPVERTEESNSVDEEWPKHRIDALRPVSYDQPRQVTLGRPSPNAAESESRTKDEPASRSRAEPAHGEFIEPEMENNRPRVLCIDDDVDITRLVRVRLENGGFDVLCAQSGEEGLRLARKERPDAIMTDLVLPEGEGVYILRQLKSHVETEDIPVIVVTGQGYEAVKRQVLQAGAASYLPKPIVFAELLNTLRIHIEARSPTNA